MLWSQWESSCKGYEVTSRLLLGTFFGLILSVVASASELFAVSGSPPEGFEALTEPWDTVVDVYYGARYLLAAQATIAPGRIRLHNPEQIVQLIPRLRRPAQVLEALRGWLGDHSDAVCEPSRLSFAGSEPDERPCGWIKPPVAGIIFDENRFRIQVFVAPEYLDTAATESTRYLPLPTSRSPGFLQVLSAIASGASHNPTNTVLYGVTSLSLRENELHSNWSIAEGHGSRLSSLYAERNSQGLNLQAGYIQPMGFGLSFTADQPVIGAHAGFSENTLSSASVRRTTPLDVFLPGRGRVEVLKDGLLLQAWLLDAGNHQLDTRHFPSGAYMVTVRVFSDGGSLVSEESRFFVGQMGLAPYGTTLWFADAGRLLKRGQDRFLPKLEREPDWLARMGLSHRLGNNWGGTAAVATTGKDFVMEAGLQWVGEWFEVSPSVLVSDHHDFGLHLNTRLYGKNWSSSLGYRKLSSSHDNSRRVLLSAGGESIYGGAMARLWSGQLQYRFTKAGLITSPGRFRKGEGQHSLSYQRTLFRDRTYEFDVRAETSRIKNNHNILLAVDMRFRRPHWQQALSARYDQQNNHRKPDNRFRELRYNTSWLNAIDDNVRSRGSAWVSAGDKSNGLGASLDYDNRFVQLDGSISHQRHSTPQIPARNDQTDITSWTASATTTISASDGVLGFGGHHGGGSVLMVQIKDAEPDAVFEILVNERVMAATHGTVVTAIPLAAFETYQVRIRASGMAFYNFSDENREVTLYPGNVVTLSFSARPVRIVFGQIRDSDGRPVAHALLQADKARAVTDSQGVYQIELPATVRSLQVKTGGRQSLIALPPYEQSKRTAHGQLPVTNTGITTLPAGHREPAVWPVPGTVDVEGQLRAGQLPAHKCRMPLGNVYRCLKLFPNNNVKAWKCFFIPCAAGN